MKYYLKDYDNISEFIATKDYINAHNKEDFNYIVNLINGCEFDIEINTDGTINLVDLMEVYLGGADSYENFANVFDACSRLEGSFLYDYYGICA